MADTATIRLGNDLGTATVDVDTRHGKWIVHVDPTTAERWWHVTYEPAGAVAAWSRDVEDMRTLAARLHAEVPEIVNLAAKDRAASKRRRLRKVAAICRSWRLQELPLDPGGDK